MTDILHINDNNLLIRRRQEVYRSQGYAWLKDDEVYFDTDEKNNAVKHCRLAPQQIYSRYWQQCDESSIAANGAGMRHAADLVWRHLRALKQQHSLQELALVVPSHYQASNLEILLGVAQACDLKVVALVNSAVLAVSNHAVADGLYNYIDLQLQQTVCSEVVVANGIAKLADIEVLHNVSAQLVQDALLKAMQHNFIQSDRFDPLHYAETEQQLFDQISLAAQNIEEHGKANLLVEHKSKLHNVSIDAKQWHAAVKPQFDRLLTKTSKAGGHCLIQLNNLFDQSLPGILLREGVSLLADANHMVLPEQATNSDGELLYLTELASTNIGDDTLRADTDTVIPESLPNGATHLLHAGVAVPLELAHISTKDNQLSLQRQGQCNAQSMLEEGRLFVINEPERKILQSNDRLGSNLADGVISVIQVLE